MIFVLLQWKIEIILLRFGWRTLSVVLAISETHCRVAQWKDWCLSPLSSWVQILVGPIPHVIQEGDSLTVQVLCGGSGFLLHCFINHPMMSKLTRSVLNSVFYFFPLDISLEKYDCQQYSTDPQSAYCSSFLHSQL
jgi:hypothetical protein